ncbi:MAG TPA: YbhN family protein [Acidimicrobiales bacterium]|nr:YbhN family protein [Acidimicrobiales bacterium]
MPGPNDAPPAPRRRRRIPREVRWGVTALAVAIVGYFLLPDLAGARRDLNQLARVRVPYLVAGVVLEAAALCAYAELTRTVLPGHAVRRSRLLRIDLSSLAVSHVVPGGTAPGTGLAYRLLVDTGVPGADAGFALAMQGVGSAVVLNALFWSALVVSIFLHGFNPLYGVAAGVGVVLMAAFAGSVLLLLRGRHWAVDAVRRMADHIPFLNGDSVARGVENLATRLQQLVDQPVLLRRAVVWAVANWLLDASCLWVFIAAFGKLVSPIDLMVAYGLANVLAVIPITPSGLGVIESVLIPTLVGFGVPSNKAILAVLGYRLVNFWLPIPVGGIAYLSLRLRLRFFPRGAAPPGPPTGAETPGAEGATGPGPAATGGGGAGGGAGGGSGGTAASAPGTAAAVRADGAGTGVPLHSDHSCPGAHG